MSVPRGGTRWLAWPTLGAAIAGGVLLAAGLGPAASAQSPSSSTTGATVSVSSQPNQQIDGFGFSEAFGQASNLAAMPSDVQSAVDNLLFSTTQGAGLDIVRFGIGGAGTVTDQLSIGKAALSYGVRTFYADAWSAPGLMKSNLSQDNGGYLCGSPGTDCINGDYRQAYAEYLAATAKAFAEQGLPLLAVDFVNEPEIGPGYPSMLMTPEQAANFIPYLGQALRKEGLSTTVACCDAEGWANSSGFNGAQAYTQTVLSDPISAHYVGLITSHGYTSAPNFPLTNLRPVWETEWSTFQPWDPAWDDGSTASGMSWANNIYTALTKANVNAFLYWWGTATYKENGDNESLIILGTPTDTTADSYQASGRLWAFAAFSRFVRPGAWRLSTNSSDPGVEAVGFRNANGSLVVVAINNNTQPTQTNFQLAGVGSVPVQAWVTDSAETMASQPAITANQGSFSATLPARSVEDFVVAQTGPGGVFHFPPRRHR